MIRVIEVLNIMTIVMKIKKMIIVKNIQGNNNNTSEHYDDDYVDDNC